MERCENGYLPDYILPRVKSCSGAGSGDYGRPMASQFLSFQPLLPPFKQNSSRRVL